MEISEEGKYKPQALRQEVDMDMNIKRKHKAIILVILPFIMGYIIDKLLMIGLSGEQNFLTSLGGLLLSVWTYGGGMILWFYVGMVFAKLNIPKVKSFVLGNLLWGISAFLYTWQFILLDDNSRNSSLAALTQHYPLGFIGPSTMIYGIFTNHFYGTWIIFGAYLLMIIVFGLGFRLASKSRSLQMD